MKPKLSEAGSNLPFISVITVVFNAEQSLEQTILSVVNQLYGNMEYIIIDGGSTDGTTNIIKKYEDKIAYWCSEKDDGIYDAMNKGLKVVKGKWVYFLGSGDILLNVFHEVAEKLTDAKTIYYGDVYRKDINKIYDGHFSPFKLAVKNICQQAIFYPLSFLNKYKFETRYKSLADHYLNMQGYGDEEYRFVYLPILICVYDGQGFTKTNNVDSPFFEDKIKIIRKNFSFTVFLYAYARRMLAKVKTIVK